MRSINLRTAPMFESGFGPGGAWSSTTPTGYGATLLQSVTGSEAQRPRPLGFEKTWTPRSVLINHSATTYFTRQIRWFEEWDDNGNPIYRYGSVNIPATEYLGFGPRAIPEVDFGPVDARARADIKDAVVNLAQNFAEYRSTCKMFADLTKDIVKTYRSLRTGSWFWAKDAKSARFRPKRFEKQAANRWLQYQYGIKPLISDLYAMADNCANRVQEGVQTVLPPIRNGVTDSYHSSSVMSFSEGDYAIVTEEQWKVMTTLHVSYRVSDASLKRLSEYGITNLAELAWELVPYSFVFDWMFNVGNVISSWDALSGVSGLEVRPSYRTFIDYNRTIGGGRHSGRWTYTERQPQRYFLSPPTIQYKPSKSFTAVANGLALLSQLRR